ncbi:hypothetical protein FRC10_000531, partial [Ceratobasidium sp. 414]
ATVSCGSKQPTAKTEVEHLSEILSQAQIGEDAQGQDVGTMKEEAQREGPEEARVGMKRVTIGEEEEASPSKRGKGVEDQESTATTTEEDLVPVICPQGSSWWVAHPRALPSSSSPPAKRIDGL